MELVGCMHVWTKVQEVDNFVVHSLRVQNTTVCCSQFPSLLNVYEKAESCFKLSWDFFAVKFTSLRS